MPVSTGSPLSLLTQSMSGAAAAGAAGTATPRPMMSAPMLSKAPACALSGTRGGRLGIGRWHRLVVAGLLAMVEPIRGVAGRRQALP